MQTPSRFHKRIRLDRQAYAQTGAICSVTIGVKDRRLVFADPKVAAAAADVLKAHAQKTGVTVYAYCVMPDHVHIVLSPSQVCDIITFVGQFKGLAQQAAWQQGVRGKFWQVSFWDHFLRKEESLEQVVLYVLNNPVRRGLVLHWRDYPHAGSLVLEVE